MIKIRNKNCVVLYDANDKEKAIAVRVSTQHDWEVCLADSRVAATVAAILPEVLQRKLILAILKEIA